MINLFPKNGAFKKQGGMATLIITVVLLVAALLIIGYAANYSILQQKTAANQMVRDQAYQAAEAGLEYGMVYLSQNSTTITASPSNGYINYGSGDSNLTNVTLANSSKYSVVYTNPTASNYQLIQITSTGTSANGGTTIVLTQQMQTSGSSLLYTVTSKGNIITSGSGTVSGSNGVHAGGSFIQSGGWNVSGVNQMDTTMATMTSAAFFSSIFGVSTTAMKAKSTYYASSSGVPWSSLSGPVWIDSSIITSSSLTIGTPANPVILIVNGPFISSGNVTINGLIYTMGDITTSGAFNVSGGMVSQGNITMSGTIAAYNAPILNQLLGGGGYARVAGSWKDF